MDEASEAVEYQELGLLADAILEECDDDVAQLAGRLDDLPVPVRDDLLSSDFFNAYQIFYFFFRSNPAEIEMERMMLLPASELQYGIRINEIDLLELIFAVVDREPVIIVSDGDRVLAQFTGKTAYRDAQDYIGSTL
jgi:hypothetical protein